MVLQWFCLHKSGKWDFYLRDRFGSKDERNYPRIMSPEERAAHEAEVRKAIENRKRTADLTENIRRLEMQGILHKKEKHG